MTEAAPKTLLKLTPRWSPLRPHPVQYRLWQSPARFKTVHAGRRSGKTETAKRHQSLTLWDCLIHPRPWRNPRFFLAGPTREQARDIWWEDMKALIPRAWIRRIRETNLSIVTKWNAEIRVLGMDKPERLEGPPWDGGIIDEFASCKAGIFDANVRPALSERKGWLWLLGVPDLDGPAQVEYENFCKVGQRKLDPEWEDFGWNSSTVLPESEMASMKRRMSKRLYDQETGGEFVKSTGRAIGDFDQDLNVNGEFAEYDPALPICWSLDFNVDPMCSGIIQHHADIVRVVDEIELANSSTPAAIEAFLDRARERGWNLQGLKVYGDPSGRARDSTSGTSDWIIIKNRLRKLLAPNAIKLPSSWWPVKDTLNALNAKVLAADNVRRLFVHPRCTGLIKDMDSALWPSDLEKQHHLAWLRYFVMYHYPVKNEADEEDDGANLPQFGVQK